MYTDHGSDLIDTYTIVESFEDMPQNELCSWCYVNLHRTMQASPHSIYQDAQVSPYLKARLEYIYSCCGIDPDPTDTKDPQYIPIKEGPVPCFTEVTYTTQGGDSCDSIARAYSAGQELCIPLSCEKLYVLADTDTCESIELDTSIGLGNLRAYNPWINYFCDNLVPTVWIHGRMLCLSPQGGLYNVRNPIPGVIVAPGGSTGYTGTITLPPANSTVAEGTTPYCGKWYTVTAAEETCAMVCTSNGITSELFRLVNPSLAGSGVGDCTGLLTVGLTYCVGPVWSWDSMGSGI